MPTHPTSRQERLALKRKNEDTKITKGVPDKGHRKLLKDFIRDAETKDELKAYCE